MYTFFIDFIIFDFYAAITTLSIFCDSSFFILHEVCKAIVLLYRSAYYLATVTTIFNILIYK